MSEKIDLDTIEKLCDIVRQNGLGEITVTSDGTVTVKSKKNAAKISVAAAGDSPPQQVLNDKCIKAPIVGTFYISASPQQEPLISVGSKVKKGDVLFIIESMKMMNEVKAEFDGVIEKILVNDGDPVEYDQTIVILS